ncbi:hypothetical protein ACIBCM_08580 [Streptomyces sp. NPDC051018]|uniref:hypothetical protein n=1 Tax=Streptomyces sp. NPDC051018 TaxID=3365639 RepID=UPI0037A5A269
MGVQEGDRLWSAWWYDGEWHDWFQVRDTVFPPKAPIATLSRNDDHMEVFGVGADGRLWGAWWDGEWRGPFTVGTHVLPKNTPVAALSRSEDYMEIFAVGEDERPRGAWWADGVWSDWYDLGTRRFPKHTPLAALSRNEDHMEVFAVDGNGRLATTWWYEGTWHDWSDLPPALVSVPDGEIVFGSRREFTLGRPVQQISTGGMMEPLVCTEARVVCGSDGGWEFTAHLDNHETECDVSFELELNLTGTSRPFTFVLRGDLSAAGDGYATRVGSRIQGVPPSRTFRESGAFELLRDPAFWREVFKAGATFTLTRPAWKFWPEGGDVEEPEEAVASGAGADRP